MDFGLSKEQSMLQESVSRYLRDHGSLARTRVFAAEKQNRASDVIAGLAELGVSGILIDETYGGVGLGLLDACVVAEALGYAVTPAPYIGTAVMVPVALARAGNDAQRQQWLPGIAAGTTIAGVALSERNGAREGAGVELRSGKLFGKALFVIDYDADVYLVGDRSGGLHLVDATAAGLTQRRLPTIDATRPVGELNFDGVACDTLPGGGTAATQLVIDAGRVALAADTLGAAQAMLDAAVAYAKTREQFDRPIASFQAVKHMCAEMAAHLEPCRSLVWYAAHAFAASQEGASISACHAKAHLAEVGTRVAKTATEVHGGMGFTDLVGLHFWFKRIGLNRQLLGGPQAVRDEAARLQGWAAA